ncbi:DUF2913 family protein [Shewanella fidelis]|uniref:DUF2913 family protein n=1 Tax=Shewanella fidelis TaxID=173509 RepID=A0AAW8NSM9_9GAMM|nr:DUF2913 family protein [Shewanella fidelis]MDR8525305.1 DUF2913 family protein [Shewanella fidelis]MDW4813658.1 DUF2913 family protein [Shewanella fidelis]MDW4817684.1 DUF2913 family protein [Shewanella fidelis]MDW4821751.1 DUF2913 family protein [Shewanella fidelis]MDW4825986.1 DUF2913 family protein [Shewanella fidelis]
MTEQSYNELLNNVVSSALLHLYLTAVESSRFIPKAQRNSLLVRYLKPKLKLSSHRPVKNELRKLLAIGRSENESLESKLNELNQLFVQRGGVVNDADKLFNLLELLRSEYRLNSRFVYESEPRAAGVIYLLQEHVVCAFSDSGFQLSPISLFLESDKAHELADIINQTKLFKAEMKQFNRELQQGHIVLHPFLPE